MNQSEAVEMRGCTTAVTSLAGRSQKGIKDEGEKLMMALENLTLLGL